MTPEQLIGFGIAIFIMVVGILGSFLPGIPSTPLVFLAALLHRIWFGGHSASTLVMVILVLMLGFSLLIEYAASMIGAKKLGATWRGIAGAVIGGIIGLFFGLVGIVLGPFVGALLFELIGGRGIEESSKAGLGAVLGLLAGALGKVACSLAMTGIFAVSVILNSA